MQSLRRTLSKRGRSKSKERSVGAGVAILAAESAVIEGELSTSPEEMKPRLFERGRKASLPTPTIDRGQFLPPLPRMTPFNAQKLISANDDVTAGSSLLQEFGLSFDASPSEQPNSMSPPDHVVIPPIPASVITHSERERAFSDPLRAKSKSRSPSPSPQFETDDPLSHHWRQSPKRSSSLLRRLSRSGHRRSGSVPSDLRRTVSDPPPEPRREDDEDVVFVPEHFQRGIEMLRVTRKKVTKRLCTIDPVSACVAWDSKSSSKRIIPSECG